MELYKTMQTYVIGYSIFIAVFMVIKIAFSLYYGPFTNKGTQQFFHLLNKLHGRITILLPLAIASILFLISWLALALPWVDLFLNTHFITSFTHEANGYTGIQTWFGVFTDEHKQAEYYFGTVFVSIVGVKGFWLIKEMLDVLKDDTLAVGVMGHWGGSRRFKKQN